MIFISDVHYQIEYLNSLPKNKGPIVILGDLINWIDYRDGQGIAMDVFGKDNVKKLINLRKEHKFDERKSLWRELYKTDPDKVAKKCRVQYINNTRMYLMYLKNMKFGLFLEM